MRHGAEGPVLDADFLSLPEPAPPQRVSVTFKRSSTKDQGDGFDLYVGEGADEAEADRVMALAIKLRTAALEAISAPRSREAGAEE